MSRVICTETGHCDVFRQASAVLPWLYRRIAHADEAVRATTPHWLVVVLPQRTLVEQTVDAARGWVEALGTQVAVHVLMGGEDSRDSEWKMYPNTGRIFVGTQDMGHGLPPARCLGRSGPPSNGASSTSVQVWAGACRLRDTPGAPGFRPFTGMCSV